jgi:putative membrane protein
VAVATPLSARDRIVHRRTLTLSRPVPPKAKIPAVRRRCPHASVREKHMVKRSVQLLIALLLAALVSAPAAGWAGARPHHDHHPAKHHVSKQDRHFAKAAARSNYFEIKSSKVALERSKDHDVRAFARLLIRDHTKAQAELARIAKAKHVKLPSRPSPAQRAVIKRLAHTKCGHFDHAYLHAQIKAHKQAIALFEKEAKEGRNKHFRAFAAKSLPVLRHHLHVAWKLHSEEHNGHH